MSQVDSSSHTFKKSPKTLPPVPLIQVNYNTTSKTSLRHPSIQVRGVPRHMIKRYVRITSDPKSRPNQTPKCSPFKQIRVQPLRHYQDSLMYKLEVRQDRYKGDMSRLDQICQDPLRIQKVAQTRPPKSPSFKKPLVYQPRHPLDILQYKLEVMEDIQSQDMSRSPISHKLVQINYLNPGYIVKYYWKTLKTYWAS